MTPSPSRAELSVADATPLQRAVSVWNWIWFPPSTGIRLAVARIVVVAFQLFIFFPSLREQLRFLGPGRGFIEPQALIAAMMAVLPEGSFPTAASLTLLFWITAAAGVLALVGLATRAAALVFALGNWILVTHQYSYGEKHHPEALLCLFLLFLAFSPSGARLSLDAWLRKRFGKPGALTAGPELTTALWPLKLMQVLLSLGYFSAGVCKLVFGGLAWMNGYTLQQHMFADAVRSDLALGMWMARQHTFCIFLSVGIIAVELFFFLTLFVPRLVPFLLLGGVLTHVGIYVTMGAPFFQFLVLYVAYCVPFLGRREPSADHSGNIGVRAGLGSLPASP